MGHSACEGGWVKSVSTLSLRAQFQRDQEQFNGSPESPQAGERVSSDQRQYLEAWKALRRGGQTLSFHWLGF